MAARRPILALSTALALAACRRLKGVNGSGPSSPVVSASASPHRLFPVIAHTRDVAISAGGVSYRLGSVLGEGQFSKVFETDDEDAVCKIVSAKVVKRGLLEREIDMLHRLRGLKGGVGHANILKMYDSVVVKQTNELGIVLEKAEGSDLLTFSNAHALTASQLQAFFKQIVAGLAHMHQLSIVHGDLRLENILVTKHGGSEYVLKLADFSLSEQSPNLTTGSYGNVHYRSPEIVLGLLENITDATQLLQVRKASDIWAAGVAFYVLACGDYPFEEADIRQYLSMFQSKCVLRVRRLSSELAMEALQDLLGGMLTVDVGRRWSIEEVSRSPFLKLHQSLL